MALTRASAALRQFIDDELLQAPMLFDMVVEGTVTATQNAFPRMGSYERSHAVELLDALRHQRHRMGQRFVQALNEAVDPSSARPGFGKLATGLLSLDQATPAMLSLVDESSIALDVELSRAIQAIRGIAEAELRELDTYTAAIAGDMEMAGEHNPFGPETMARALWEASQALTLSRGHQVAFMRHAGDPLAHVLKRNYAAGAARLEALGIEPARYGTMIRPSGSRRGSIGSNGFSNAAPDFHQMLESMPVPLDAPGGSVGHDTPYRTAASGTSPASAATAYTSAAVPARRPPSVVHGGPGASLRQSELADLSSKTASRVDRQAIELVSRIFGALAEEPRMPADIKMLLSRLHGPAMRMTLRDGSVLDQDRHALWSFINRLAYHAEMMPDGGDPERTRLLRLASQLIDQIATAAQQHSHLYDKTLAALDAFLHQKLARRCSAASSQIGALQKLEDKLMRDEAASQFSTLSGIESHPLDLERLDTVPAELIEQMASARKPIDNSRIWLDELAPGTWVRLFLQGRWLQVQLLWPGERRRVWLFGDGASDATFAIQRSALLTLHAEGLAKTLIVRSMVAAAARRVARELGATA